LHFAQLCDKLEFDFENKNRTEKSVRFLFGKY